MRGWLPVAIMAAGGAIAVLSTVAGNLLLMRGLRSTMSDPNRQRAATPFALAYPLLLIAAAGACGVGILIVGGVLGFGASAWALLMPAGLLVVSLGGAWLVRRRLRQATQL